MNLILKLVANYETLHTSLKKTNELLIVEESEYKASQTAGDSRGI